MPWLGFSFTMVHLSINQVTRQFSNNPSVVDITGAQMVLVMKLCSFCWNVYDGYIMFFPSLMAGPAFEYAEYRRYLDCTMFDTPSTAGHSKPLTRKVPKSGTPAIIRGAYGLFWITVFIELSKHFSPTLLYSEQGAKRGLFTRMLIMYLVNMTTRTKYYGVWTLAEGASILAGIGYNGVDPKTGELKWNRVRNIDPWGVESAQNTRAYLGNWNMNTNAWLRNCIYLRVTPKGQKPGFKASLATFTTSALWHGFYPGYYFSFILASFVQTAAKNFRRYVRPFFLDPRFPGKGEEKPTQYKIFYDIISWFATQFVFCFVTTPFLVLGARESVLAWGSVYFYAIIGTILSLAFFNSPAKVMLKKKAEERIARAAGKRPETLNSSGAAGEAVPGASPAANPLAAATGADLDGEAHGVTSSPADFYPSKLQHASTFSTIRSERKLPVLGLPDDPARDIDDMIDEVERLKSNVIDMLRKGVISKSEAYQRLADLTDETEELKHEKEMSIPH